MLSSQVGEMASALQSLSDQVSLSGCHEKSEVDFNVAMNDKHTENSGVHQAVVVNKNEDAAGHHNSIGGELTASTPSHADCRDVSCCCIAGCLSIPNDNAEKETVLLSDHFENSYLFSLPIVVPSSLYRPPILA